MIANGAKRKINSLPFFTGDTITIAIAMIAAITINENEGLELLVLDFKFLM